MGEPVQVLTLNEDHNFELNEEVLNKYLLADDVKDCYVAVISVAGVFRKGKSFLLNFFLKYLSSEISGNGSGEEDWMGSEEEPLNGFHWAGGSERDTTGIVMWSNFYVRNVNNDKIAIILLDTQGTFDSNSTLLDCATVFTLSTMLSSVQIYNLSQNIQEDDLQHLQLFTEYGRLAVLDTGIRPFQKLLFLVRDWSYPYEAEYGCEGGQKILDRRLKMMESQHPELQSVRKHIKFSFQDLGCFLLPHPGLQVSCAKNFDGRLKDVSSEFKNCVRDLADQLLSPNNLIVKEINGQKLKVKDLVQYFRTYMSIYKEGELPEPKSVFNATAEANHLAAVATAKEQYRKTMDDLVGGKNPYLNHNRLLEVHNLAMKKALNDFILKPKMGGKDFSERYYDMLQADLKDLLEVYSLQNESKNVLKATKATAVFLILAVIAHIASGFFSLLGFFWMSSIFSLASLSCICILCAWLYIRFTGEYTSTGLAIDSLALAIWDNFMKPCYLYIVQKSLQCAIESPPSISSPSKLKIS